MQACQVPTQALAPDAKSRIIRQKLSAFNPQMTGGIKLHAVFVSDHENLGKIFD